LAQAGTLLTDQLAKLRHSYPIRLSEPASLKYYDRIKH